MIRRPALPNDLLPPDLSRRDENVTEHMDDPFCDPDYLNRTYSQFPTVNKFVARWRHTYRNWLKPLMSEVGVNTLLDIGSGGGDISRAIAQWAAVDGFLVDITAIDPDQRAHTFANRQPTVPGVAFRQAHSSLLVSEGLTFDFVISNHVLHHLAHDQFLAFLQDSRLLARRRAVHSDIARSTAGYRIFSFSTLPFFHRSFIRSDGLTSIRRSYTTSELEHAAPGGWRVRPQFPSRHLLTYDCV